MNNTQLYFAIGLPTMAVLLGMLTNALVFNSLSSRMNSLEGRFQGLEGRFQGLEGRFQSLDTKFDTRFDLLTSKVIDVDTMLTRLEERLERR